MKIAATIIGNTLYTALVLGVIALTLLFLGTRIPLLGYEVKVVLSGSMEPVIHTGSIIVIAPADSYKVGEVITFGKDTKKNVPISHRIVEKTGEGKSAVFATKGDANEDRDPTQVHAREIIGKELFTIPYLGYVIEFARTRLGFALLIGIPALIIILDEFANIVWEVRKYRARVRYMRERALRREPQQSVYRRNQNRTL